MSRGARDVVVVGGGPAGSAVATLLARQGHDVLLVDEARFPRDKVCGEGFSPEAWRLLDAIGASGRVRALEPWPLRGMRLVSPGGTSFRGEYRGRDRPGFALRRLALDAALLDAARAAGVEVREGVRVTSLLYEKGAVAGVTVSGATDASGESEATVGARVVVGADGRRSVVARRLGLLREHPTLRRFAVRGHWDGMAGLEPFGEMHVAERAYCGVAPLSERLANVAFVLEASEMAAAAGDLEAFYRRTLRARWPALAERLARARLCEPPRAIGPLALECRGVAAAGAVLVGDAAGFYDPFTGEGVTLALRTAELAAAAIAAAFRAHGGRQPLPALSGYARERDRATRDKFRFNRLLQLAVSHAAVAEAIATRLARRPDLADRLVGIAGDFVPARAALGPRFLLNLLRA
jgi:menaquinone-9 beta-reductase